MLLNNLKYGLLAISLLISTHAFSQVDWGSWKSVQLNYIANDRITLKLRPILRLNDDFGNHNNSSIDAVVAYKISKNWSTSILNRHFFVPDAPDVEFLFFDLKHQTNLTSKVRMSNLVRYHLNFDWIGSRTDFIRWHWGLQYDTGKKIKPIFTSELWFRTKYPTEISGARFIFGSVYKMNSSWTLQTMYWRQAGYKTFPIANTHTIILNLIYTFKQPIAN